MEGLLFIAYTSFAFFLNADAAVANPAVNNGSIAAAKKFELKAFPLKDTSLLALNGSTELIKIDSFIATFFAC